MKKLYNIFDENYPQSKFDKLMVKVTAVVLLVGLIFFLLVIASLIKQNTSIVFYNKINPVAVFMQNHGVNFKVIWIDCSPYIVGWFVFIFVPLVMWLANNYKRSLRNEYLVKTTSKLCALNLEIDKRQKEIDAFAPFVDYAKKEIEDRNKTLNKLNDNFIFVHEKLEDLIKKLKAENRELKAANKILRESNMRLFEKTPASRLRDEKGHFLPKPKNK